MNYIITGGTGFIGTHLANLIKEQDENAQVWNLDIVDPEVMEDLGDAAIPATVRLAREMSERGETVNEEIAELLEEKAEELEYGKEGIFSFTIPSKRAKDALAEYGITEK